MTTKDDLRTRWTAKANTVLAGRRIESVFYMSQKEADDLGWYQLGLVINLDNGLQLMLQQDDEGNGPGALFCANETEDFILPTL